MLRLPAMVLLLATSGRGWAQVPVWQLAMTGNTQTGTGASTALASAADANGNVFITGFFSGTATFGSIQLANTGSGNTLDMFVAKWDATAQAFTWATSGGGGSDDLGSGIAVRGTGVFVTGRFNNGPNVRIAGQLRTGPGGTDMFVAKYIDTSTGHTPATSSFANGWVATGGGLSTDLGTGITTSGANVYVTGVCRSSSTIAGQPLASNGMGDVFVAKYIDTSTGNTTATSSFANGWATSGGGTGDDGGLGIAVSGTGVYVTGRFSSNGNTSIAGQLLTGAGGMDMFVAKYLDTSTGNTPTTSSFADAWAIGEGGPGDDFGSDLAVNGRNVYVTGTFVGGANTTFVNQALAGPGGTDMFVAKYIDTSTPTVNSVGNGWVISDGGTGNDAGAKITVSGTSVLVVGSFASGTNASFAGQSLAGAGGQDIFEAKYTDTSTLTTNSVARAGAISGGGGGNDQCYGMAVHGQQVYAVGVVATPATFGSITLGPAGSGQTVFLARLTDPTLPLATQPATRAPTTFTLFPNPAHTACIVQDAPAGMVLTVLDALGRTITAATADAVGTARLALRAGLPAGVYVVRGGGLTRRLAVE